MMCKQGNEIVIDIPSNITILKNDDIGTPRKSVCIDGCMENEIKSLRERGIVTTGCCCGHGAQSGYIGVLEEYIEDMRLLGYKKQVNPHYPEDESYFIPITKIQTN